MYISDVLLVVMFFHVIKILNASSVVIYISFKGLIKIENDHKQGLNAGMFGSEYNRILPPL